MWLQTDEETFVDIDGIEVREGEFEVYNFEVEEFHTYFVSDLGLLVHNVCNPGRGAGGYGAASEFGSLNGDTLDDIDSFLIGRGAKKSSSGAYDTYKFPDGSRVDIRLSDKRITRSPMPVYDTTGKNMTKGRRLDQNGNLVKTRNPDGSLITGGHDSSEYGV
ncbi:MAG: hypothetical protein SAL07_25375 [Oscillatoria sp. PMC 1051.18]|nr:hypothetical protein [Oscillatoria sp. PMC 1050.18]MEC5033239.1 hypothetical protein [Oscillatoria sp. PMC 1051.18]